MTTGKTIALTIWTFVGEEIIIAMLVTENLELNVMRFLNELLDIHGIVTES